jgi:hypothetical protein
MWSGLAMKAEIFVFGSNLAGRHGKGAALEARNKYNAVYGQGIGIQGMAYAIPTKDEGLRTLPLDQIELYVDEFTDFAYEHPEMIFNMTLFVCGLTEYAGGDIAPLFECAPENVILPNEWKETILEK